MTVPHPMQPIVIDEHGTARFKENKIVSFITRDRLNELCIMTQEGMFLREDYEHLMMLIGYSVSGFGGLSMVDPETVAKADAIVEGILT